MLQGDLQHLKGSHETIEKLQGDVQHFKGQFSFMKEQLAKLLSNANVPRVDFESREANRQEYERREKSSRREKVERSSRPLTLRQRPRPALHDRRDRRDRRAPRARRSRSYYPSPSSSNEDYGYFSLSDDYGEREHRPRENHKRKQYRRYSPSSLLGMSEDDDEGRVVDGKMSKTRRLSRAHISPGWISDY